MGKFSSNKALSETLVFHPAEWILWALCMITALAVVCVVVTPPADSQQQQQQHLVGASTWRDISNSVARQCSTDERISCSPHGASGFTFTLEHSNCTTTTTRQAAWMDVTNPALAKLGTRQTCRPVSDQKGAGGGKEKEEAFYNETSLLDNGTILTPNQSLAIETVQEIFRVSIPELWDEWYRLPPNSYMRVRLIEIFWKSLLDALMLENDHYYYYYHREEATLLFRKDQKIPRFSRNFLHRLLTLTVIQHEKSLLAAAKLDQRGRPSDYKEKSLEFCKQMKDVILNRYASDMSYPDKGSLPTFSNFLHTDDAIVCLQRLYNRGYLISWQCRKAVEIASQRSREIEIYMDIPLAWLVRNCYIVLGVVALVMIGRPLGELETPKQARRRRFIQVLQDPLLRRAMERDAREHLKDDKEVAKFMAGMDAKAQAMIMQDDNVDDEWKRKEAIRLAWKARVRQVWDLRKLLVLLWSFSCLLQYLDSPQAGMVMQGGLVVTVALVGTYFCLPQAPEQQSKMMEARVPLLSREINPRLV